MSKDDTKTAELPGTSHGTAENCSAERSGEGGGGEASAADGATIVRSSSVVVSAETNVPPAPLLPQDLHGKCFLDTREANRISELEMVGGSSSSCVSPPPVNPPTPQRQMFDSDGLIRYRDEMNDRISEMVRTHKTEIEFMRKDLKLTRKRLMEVQIDKDEDGGGGGGPAVARSGVNAANSGKCYIVTLISIYLCETCRQLWQL